MRRMMIALLCLAAAVSTFAAAKSATAVHASSVKIASPIPGSTSTSAVSVIASASESGAFHLEVWDNGKKLGNVMAPDVNAVYTVSTAGAHTLTVEAVTNSGSTILSKDSVAYTVNDGPMLPAPPANAVTFSNLQDSASVPGEEPWKLCNGTCTTGKGTSTAGACKNSAGAALGTASLDLGVETPSLTGAAMQLTAACPLKDGYWNSLAYRKFTSASQPTFSHVERDFWIYVGDVATQQAQETDPDIYTGKDELFISQQFGFQGDHAGLISLWNMNAAGKAGEGEWVATAYLNTLIPNSWNHIQSYDTFDQAPDSNGCTTGSYTYQTLIVNGEYVYQNLGRTFCGKAYKSAQELNFQFQADLSGAVNASATVGLDKAKEIFW